jgi:hypothetical protein
MYKSFEDYIANTTKAQRQAHVDLSTDCSFISKKGKTFTSKRRSQDAARENIVEFLIEQGILDINLSGAKFGKNGKVQANHCCACHSGNDNVVCNSYSHIYLGTAQENFNDINLNTGLSAAESSKISKNTPESKEKASLSQKLSWAERKARILATDKE